MQDVERRNSPTIRHLRKRCQQDGDGLSLPDDVLLLIADRIRSNIRDLEGCLVRVLALGSLLNRSLLAQATANPMAVKPPHFAPKARRLIYLFMNGAPSQIDMWDYKPRLAELFDMRDPCDQLLKEHLHLHACEMQAHAAVRASPAESDMRVGVA